MATPKRSLVSRAGVAARKVVARKSAAAAPAKKAAAKKAVAKKAAPAKKAALKKAAPAEEVAVKKAAKKTAVKKAAVKKAAVKKADPAKKVAAPAKKAPAKLVVLEKEAPWTKAELKQVRAQLDSDIERLTLDLADVEEDLAEMITSSEGAGNDQADVGSASFERDQEMTIRSNAREMLVQSQHALERIDDGTYGICESCGNPIGKNRLMAFPRATMCMTCKQRQERR